MLNQVKGEIIEFNLGSGAQPFDIAIDASNNIWFTEIGMNNIGRLDVKSAIVKDYQADLSVKLSVDERKIFEQKKP